MQSRVDDDPGDEESRRTGHESLLGQFPHSAVLLLVHLLEADAVDVSGAGGCAAKQRQRRRAAEPEDAEDDAQDDAQDLPHPVERVQERLLVRPRRLGRQRHGQHGREPGARRRRRRRRG